MEVYINDLRGFQNFLKINKIKRFVIHFLLLGRIKKSIWEIK